MLSDSYRLRLGHFCIPQRRVLPLAELRATAAAAQIAEAVLPVDLAYREIVLSYLAVKRAAFIDARQGFQGWS